MIWIPCGPNLTIDTAVDRANSLLTVVAIHQPNFFPWLGYFDKIAQADIFVFLDAVGYPRSGSSGMGSWTNRVHVCVNGAPHWLTAPIRRMPFGALIQEARIDDSRPWRKKALKTISGAYAKASQRTAAMEILTPLVLRDTDRIADYNIANIEVLVKHLGLSTRFFRQSELKVEGVSTERLVNIVKAVGGTAYLSGGGASGYQEESAFLEAGIELVMQNFEPLPYGPEKSFIPRLSVIDYLMRDGRKFAGSS